jgi:hypothetical protein
MLWRRTPRAVYEVYGEDEYLSDGSEPVAEQPVPLLPIDDRGTSWSARLIGIGLLMGVVVSAIALVLLSAPHPSTTHSGDTSSSRISHIASTGAPSGRPPRTFGGRRQLTHSTVPRSRAHAPEPIARRILTTGSRRVGRLTEPAHGLTRPWVSGLPRPSFPERSGREVAGTVFDGEFGFEH